MSMHLAGGVIEETFESYLRKLFSLSSRLRKNGLIAEEKGEFPFDSFKLLHQEGLLGASVPGEYGGLGYGPVQGRPQSLWLLTKEVAATDLSLARCWEGHHNACCLIDGLADEKQKKRFFKGIVDDGHIWAAWSGEPLTI